MEKWQQRTHANGHKRAYHYDNNKFELQRGADTMRIERSAVYWPVIIILTSL